MQKLGWLAAAVVLAACGAQDDGDDRGGSDSDGMLALAGGEESADACAFAWSRAFAALSETRCLSAEACLQFPDVSSRLTFFQALAAALNACRADTPRESGRRSGEQLRAPADRCNPPGEAAACRSATEALATSIRCGGVIEAATPAYMDSYLSGVMEGCLARP